MTPKPAVKMTPSTSQAHGKRIKTKSTWWFLTEVTLSVAGTNTHGLQIHVKQYQGCSRAGTGKSRCCPKQDLLAKFNVHNTHQEIRALSWVRRDHGKCISSKHQWTKWQSWGRIQPRSPRFIWPGWVCLYVQLLGKKGASYRNKAWLKVSSYWKM